MKFYQMLIDGNEQWLSLKAAGFAYAQKLSLIEIGNLVRDNGTERTMTLAEKRNIQDYAL